MISAARARWVIDISDAFLCCQQRCHFPKTGHNCLRRLDSHVRENARDPFEVLEV